MLADTDLSAGQHRASLPVMVSLVPFRIIIGWPSSLLQVIRGGGWPVALHQRVAFSPSDTERSPLVSSYTMSGGTGTGKQSNSERKAAVCLLFESGLSRNGWGTHENWGIGGFRKHETGSVVFKEDMCVRCAHNPCIKHLRRFK